MPMSSTMRSTTSVYSQVSTGRSNTQRSRSLRSITAKPLPWYQKPLLREHKWFPIQKAAVATSLGSIVMCIFTMFTAAFDIYCLAMAAPGSTHYGYYFISYEFVYVGNMHVRNALIVMALFSMMGALVVLATSAMLFAALRKEFENQMVPWMWSFPAFIVMRFLALLLFAIVNDMVFGYNIFVVIIWSMICVGSVYGWLLVHTCYLEFANITRLEDLAHLRMGTMASLHASMTPSTSESRPFTPYPSTVHTITVE